MSNEKAQPVPAEPKRHAFAKPTSSEPLGCIQCGLPASAEVHWAPWICGDCGKPRAMTITATAADFCCRYCFSTKGIAPVHQPAGELLPPVPEKPPPGGRNGHQHQWGYVDVDPRFGHSYFRCADCLLAVLPPSSKPAAEHEGGPREEVEPCPFCITKGKPFAWESRDPKANNRIVWCIACEVCACEGPEADTEGQAVKLWNTRARPSPAATLSPSEAARRAAERIGMFTMDDLSNDEIASIISAELDKETELYNEDGSYTPVAQNIWNHSADVARRDAFDEAIAAVPPLIPKYDEFDNFHPSGKDIDPRYASGWNAAIAALEAAKESK